MRRVIVSLFITAALLLPVVSWSQEKQETQPKSEEVLARTL